MTLDDLLRTTYVEGGRGPQALDCWGLVRLARVHLFGRPLLPDLMAAEPGNIRAITRAVDEIEGGRWLTPGAQRPGAIATGWRASLCVHVGIVVDIDGRAMLLETDRPTGPCLTSVRTFEARYSRTTYYDDLCLPQPDAG